MSKLVYRVCRRVPLVSGEGAVYVKVERHTQETYDVGVVVCVFSVHGRYRVDWRLDEALYKYDTSLTSPDEMYDSLRGGLNSKEMSRCLRQLK